jgi:hypothetical protein
MKLLATLLALLCLAKASANDCIPLTFMNLSSMVGERRSYEEWKSLTMPDGMTSPTIASAIRAWDTRQELSKLLCIYSIDPRTPFRDEGLKLDTPYLWIGFVPSDMAAVENERVAHSAILVLGEDRTVLIHTMDPTGKRMEEILPLSDLLNRTLLLFKVDRLIEFVHFGSTGEVITIDRRGELSP